MSNIVDFDRSLDLAKRAIAHAQKHGMAPTPRNFEIWYQYVSGENGALNEDIDRRISDSDEITETAAGEIQNQFFSPSQDADNVVSLSSKISVEIEQAIAVIGAAAGTNSAYGNSLEGVGSQIGKIKSADDLRTIAETLVLASREMEKNSRELEAKLEASKSQITSLKGHLDEVRNESRTDALTGIPNRKHFDERFASEAAQAAETQEELCLVVADIDHFKKFNDSHGHQTGDQVLKLVAKLLSANIKGRDMAARFGGEEFTILLPQTNLRAAVTVADQIREKVRTKELIKKSTNENLGAITLSLGVARYRPGETTDELFQRADACLYAAKHAGRDNVKCEADPDIDLSTNAA
ncbi:hypothetical protein MNBD_ALPHA09-1562 [hydrothermal vent metagenome]|uniref:GGDEF domain-containing protein n=1 Tax=hydrothermal vent metagenome TaxID=652676 RepID=A0A3B0TKA2_9ZZZZ